MATYSVAEARTAFADLIDRALAGEHVSITRNGERVVDLVPSRPEGFVIDVEWIKAHQIALDGPGSPDPDGLHIVECMRRNEEL